jgi:hypothetical protein
MARIFFLLLFSSCLAGCSVWVDHELEGKQAEADVEAGRDGGAADGGAGEPSGDAQVAASGPGHDAAAPGQTDPAGSLGSGSAPDGGPAVAAAGGGVVSPGAAKEKLCVGVSHACGLLPSGRVVCWGNSGSDDGQTTLQTSEPELRFVDLACGDYHSCGVTTGGRVKCVGRNRDLQSLPPADPGFVAVAAGDTFSCALRADQTVACWGGAGDLAFSQPPGDAFLAIAAGSGFACGIRALDRGLRCWGSNTTSGRTSPPSLVGFRSLDLGGAQGCAVDDRGSVLCWGDGSDALPALTAQAVAVGGGQPQVGDRACALLTNHDVTCWIDGKVSVLPGPTRALAVGESASCFLSTAGELRCDSTRVDDPIRDRAPQPYPTN